MGKANFSDEFKRDAVARITNRGYAVGGLASLAFGSQRLGVSRHAWTRPLSKFVSGDASKDAEIRHLKRELARMTKERNTLKSHRVFRKGWKVRYALIAEHSDRFGVRTMCRCLAVQPSGFYAWQKSPLRHQAREDGPSDRFDPQSLER